MLAVRPNYVSESEFLQLPESTDKVELIDGEIFLAPAPTVTHQRLVATLLIRLGNWCEANAPSVVLCAPIDVRFGRDRILQPDVVLFLEALDLERSPIDQVPSLCVEVLSRSSRSHDRVTKRFVYAAAGVREYWVVDPGGHVERWSGDLLSTGDAVLDVLETPLLPGFSLSLGALFGSV